MNYNLYIYGILRHTRISSLRVEELMMTAYRLVRAEDIYVAEV